MKTTDIVTLCISSAAFVFSLLSFFLTYRHEKKRTTIEAWGSLQDKVLDRLNNYGEAEVEKAVGDPESDGFHELETALARVEHFCTGVVKRVYDRKTLYSLAGGYLNRRIYRILDPLAGKKEAFGTHDYYNNFRKTVAMLNRYDKKKEEKLKKEKNNHEN